MPTQPAQWWTDPLEYFEEGDGGYAVASLRAYKRFTGHLFDKIAALSCTEPYKFTWSDIASVSGLSVSIESPTAWNIVHEDGLLTRAVNALLREIDPTLELREASDSDLAPAYELWGLLKGEEGMGGGGVVLSKLLAAKRPHLLPIRDFYVLNALFQHTKLDRHGDSTFDFTLDDWEAWRQLFHDELWGARLSLAAAIASATADYEPSISVLRTVDIVVWMRHKGWKDGNGNVRDGLPHGFDTPPTFLGAIG